MQREAGTARMISTGGVDEQDVRCHRERADRCLQAWPFAQGEQARDVGGGSRARDRRFSYDAASQQYDRSGPGAIAAGAASAEAAREDDRACANGKRRAGWVPRLRRRSS